MPPTSLAAVFIYFGPYDLEIPLCTDGGRLLGRYAYHLYYQQTTGKDPLRLTSATYTRTHRVVICMATLLVVFAAFCTLGMVMDLFPLHDLSSEESAPTSAPLSPPLKVVAGCEPRGVRRSTVQTSVSTPERVHCSSKAYAAVGTSTGCVDAPMPALAGDVGATNLDHANRGRAIGVRASPCCVTNPASPAVDDSLSGATPPTVGERASDKSSARPTSASEFGVPRGSVPSPAQLRPSPCQPHGAPGNIQKSLYPLILDPIETDPNGVPSTSTTCQSRESPCTRLGGILPVTLQRLVNCYMLVVAVGVGGLKDPFIDLRFLQGIPKSAVVKFRSLSGRKVTPKLVRHKLRQLYIETQKAGASSWVLVYLTGMGDHQGNMRLFGRNTIGVQDLEDWLAGIPGPRLHVGVVFDVCRGTYISTTPNRHCNLAPVWSCSMEQWAYALDFGENMPSSCFLNSIFLAAHDVLVGHESFEAAFKRRMAQQRELLRFIYRKRHEGNGRCKNCPEGDKCDLPEPQVAEWGPSGFDTFLILGKLIMSEFPDVAHHVEARMTEKMRRWKFLCDMSVNAVATPDDMPLSSEARHSTIIDDTSCAWEGSEAESQTLAPGAVSRLVRVEFALPRNNVSIFGYSV